MIPSSVERVPRSTSPKINNEIRQDARQNIAAIAAQGRSAINNRLLELEREWDVERLLECNASSIAFTGVALGALVDKRFLVLPALVTGFLFQHAIQGWCPPLPILRRMGFRTAQEIDEERSALKIIRGDYQDLSTNPSSKLAHLDQILLAIRKR